LLALSAFLAAFGNLATWLFSASPPGIPWLGLPAALVLVGALVVWADRVARLTPTELGLSGAGLARSAGVGLLVAVVAGGAALVFLRFPPLLHGPVVYESLSNLLGVGLVWRVGLWMPLDTALPEEFAFRGVLLASLLRSVSPVRASLLSAAVFMLWHAAVITRTLGETNLRDEPLFLAVGVAGAWLAVFVGGVLFAALRIRTRHLAGSVLAHWAFNAVLLVGVARPAT
jgi:membrane protease YdiL (CAAX protease family)